MKRSTYRNRLFLSALEDRRTPATYSVDALTDTGAGTGLAGDLRYCITQAQANPGADVIDASGVIGTILLSSQLPTIGDDLAIFGPGPQLLNIDGNLGTRLLQITGSGATTVDVSGLKLSNAGTTSNGGVANIAGAKVTFSNSVLNNSFANVGGLLFGSASSEIHIVNCTLSGSSATAGGGAVYTTGSLTIRSSTLSGNNSGTFGSGGAVAMSGAATVNIVNSTLSSNTAGVHGGAIRALSSFSGTLTIKNSTITQNKVTDSSGTGRGISRASSGGQIDIVSSIVAQNIGGASNTSDVTGTIKSAYSIFGTADAATITGVGNFKGTNASPVNAKLGPLTNNGGTMATHLPMNDSPAREAGVTPDLLTEDQRGPGFDRTEGYFTDIGAVETQYLQPMASADVPLITTKSSDTTFQFQVTYHDKRGSQLIDVSTIGNGDIYVSDQKSYLEFPTLISAVPGADAQTVVATYEMPVPVYGAPGWDISDNGDYGILMLSDEVFDRDTPTPTSVTIVYFAFIRVQIPVVYTVDEATDIVDGKTDAGELSLREAINIANTDSQFSKIVFDPNVFDSATTITLSGTELAINGALTLIGPTAPLTLDADAKSRILNTSGTDAYTMVEISNLTVTNGKYTGASQGGGGILIGDENVVLDRVVISNSSGNNRGGGIFINGYQNTANNVVTLQDCVVSGNSASFGGGVYFGYGGTLNIVRTAISNNTSSASGAAINALRPRSLNLMDCAITGNQAWNAGAIYFRTFIFDPDSAMSIINTTISSNTAVGPNGKGFGGGILYHNGTNGQFAIRNSTITGNTAGTDAGGLYIVYGFVDLQSNIIAGNNSGDGRDIYGVQLVGRGPITITGANNLIGVDDTGKMKLEPGNLTGTKAAPLDGKLAPLADNGGPTMTHALLPGSPAINAGSNVLGLAFDQRGTGFVRTVSGQTDIGAFEVQATPTPPAKISMFKVNDGSAQRSRVTSLTIDFDSSVTLPANPESAFELERKSDSMVVDLDAVVTGNSVTLTFTGGPLNFGSLADGRYTLTAFASLINAGNFDGNGDGTPGDDYEFVGSPANGLFRLFGDADGNGTVNTADFNAFRSAFGGSNPIFDFDNAGGVGTLDFNQFRARFGSSV